MASTINSHSDTSLKCSSHSCAFVTSTTVTPTRPRISRFVRASPRTSTTLPSRNTIASMPRCASVRATTKPSPPLLPRPHRTPTRLDARSSNAASMAATACRPAFSMSTIEGIPTSSIVCRSASRICCVLRTRMYCVCYTPADMRGAVYVNGKIAPADQAVVPVYDHGFVYGEGVYETLRTYNKVPFLYDRHVRRLRRSAEQLLLDVPFDDATLMTWIEQTMRAAGPLDE